MLCLTVAILKLGLGYVTFGTCIPDIGNFCASIIFRVVSTAVKVVIAIIRAMAKTIDTTRLPKFFGSNPPISLYPYMSLEKKSYCVCKNIALSF